MWNSIRRSCAAQATRSRRVGVVVALLACFGLAACTATEPPSPASTAEADTIAPFPESGVIDAGTYLVTGYPVPFQITVPDGWETFDGAGVGKDDPDLPDSWNGTVLFWPATHVPTDACAWSGALVQVDPTAEAFVDAMTAQASTVSTNPVKVVAGDYSGFEFDYAVASDVDITDCDGGKLCVYSNSAQDCDGRVYRNVGERETYRAVDLNGERAVIAVGQSHESMNPELTREARAIFDSIEFRSDE
ncbi:hypothetical protein [Arthrobacter rhizosphaerae]|uniref:hypothetical protein n=1 Tax=Arthrobacter rhizosphaerae TaxID=2855490 RepID=UPI001FF339B7|nr:hypothetical protein [Arthrobacter rhizosphaerae]